LIDDKPFLENIEDISILQKVLKQIYEIIWLCYPIFKR
jgi:hypothetical protein